MGELVFPNLLLRVPGVFFTSELALGFLPKPWVFRVQLLDVPLPDSHRTVGHVFFELRKVAAFCIFLELACAMVLGQLISGLKTVKLRQISLRVQLRGGLELC